MRLRSLILTLILFSFGPGPSHAQTQHGAAPGDQPILLPPPRPVAGAEGNEDLGELFPQTVESDRFLRISTGPVRGGYYAVGGVICDLVNRHLADHRIECLVKPTSGSAENIAQVLGGGAEMGLVQSDWQSFAVTSAELSAGQSLNFDRLRSVAALYPLALQLVVREGQGIDGLQALGNQPLGLPLSGSGQRQLADVVLAQAGLRLSDLTLSEYEGDADMARAFCAQEIQAFFLVGPAPIQSVDVALNRCGGQLLSLDGQVIETLIGDREALTRLSLGAASYPSQATQINTLGFVVTLVASAGLDDRMVAEVARHLVEGVESYASAHPALSSVDGSGFFTGGLTAPVHNGVARYLDTLIADFQAGDSNLSDGDSLLQENGG